MNINQLTYVITIAQYKSFSKAAQALFISQPSLSQSVGFLEKELGVKLFERKPLKLTYAGEIFTDWAKKVLSLEKEMKQKIEDIAENKNIKLTIGVSPYRCSYLLPQVILSFQKEYPQCKLILEEHPTDILKKLLEEDKIDLLIDTPHPDTFLYESISILKESILIGIPINWEFEGERSSKSYPEIDLQKLKNKPFIMLTKNQLIGKIGRDLCTKNGFNPNILLECHNIETVYSMIEKGMGAAFIPELFAKSVEKNNKMKCFSIKNSFPERDLAIIHRKNKYLAKATLRFIEIFKDEVINNFNKPKQKN